MDNKLKRSDIEEQKLQQQDVDFINDSKAAMLSKTTPFANTLLYLLILFVIVMLVWAKIGQLDEVTRGMATVVPSSQIQIIQNLEGGIVTKILVKKGETVTKGQALAQLDKTQFSAQYREAHTKYITLLADIARLEAETQKQKQITFPAAVKQSPALVKYETALFDSKQENLKNTLQNLQGSYNLAQQELAILEPLAKKGVISQVELLRIKREVGALKTKIDTYEDEFYQTSLTELNQNKHQAAILAETLAALKDRMHRTTLYAPVTGIIKQIYANTVGGVIKSGHPIMEIVPLNDQLIVETKIKPSDIAFIKVGQKAKVKITAYDYAIYGGLDATVNHISADTTLDKSGKPFYEVDLITAKNYLGSKPGSFPIIPGMTASVDILTGKKPMLTYLLKPLFRAKEKAMRER